MRYKIVCMKIRFLKLLLVVVAFAAVSLSHAQEAIPQFLKHQVKSGETLTYIANKYRVNKKDILLLNDFPPDKKVAEGDVVLIRTLTEKEALEMDKAVYAQPSKKAPKYVPEPETVEEEPAKAAPSKATKQPVKETTVAPVQKTNSAPAASSGNVEVGPGGTKYAVGSSGYHVVEKGQTFYRIALIYGLSVEELKQINNMSNMNISVGQKLKVKR